MHLIPFMELFPEQAVKETRTLIILRHPVLPPDDYGLIEAYCPDPECDCQRVMLNVYGRNQGSKLLAAISYGFDRDDEFAGPFLDPMNRQSRYAEALLEQVAQVLEDPEYVARLQRHYAQVKRVAGSLARFNERDSDESPWSPPLNRAARRAMKKRKS